MDKVIKLAIVDDSDFFRKGLISHIAGHNQFKILIEGSNGKELIAALKSEKQKPDVILLDLEMPVMDGIKATEYISKHYPHIRILILTVHAEERILFHLIKKGAHGFLKKDTSIDKVGHAIQAIYANDYYFAGFDLKKTIAAGNNPVKSIRSNGASFTTRELEVLNLVCQQYTNQEISDKLHISIRTVHSHRSNILQKTNALNVTGLVLYAIKHGLIEQV